MINFFLFLSLSVLSLGPFIVWPSRYNVLMMTNFGFVFVAYFVPLVALDETKDYSFNILSLYQLIHFVGTFFYLLGLFLGKFFPLLRTSFTFNLISIAQLEQRTVKIVRAISLFSIIGLIISFCIMGFIPAFTSDPLMAKFFKGPYREPYLRIALLYRLCFFLSSIITPFLFVIAVEKKSKFYGFLLGIITILLLMTLSRGPAANGLLIGLALIAAKKGRIASSLFAIIITSIYIFGSISYYLLGVLFSIEGMTALYDTKNIWKMIASGSPDIKDQLDFLTAFINQDSPFTYGRTFLGGLIPGSFRWNPSIWTLSILNPGVDLTETSSGGLRLTLPLWGYTSFGWIGVLVLPFISGILTSYVAKFIKKWFKINKDLIRAIIIISLYNCLGMQIINFYLLSMYSIPVVLSIFLFSYRIKLK